MKKLFILLFLGVCSFVTISIRAEEKHVHKGKIFLGGMLSVWGDPSEKTFSLNMEPEFGYLFNHKWGIGLMLSYNINKEKKINFSQREIKMSPFARYYFAHKGPFNLYMDGGFGLNYEITEKNFGYEIGIKPGACIDLTDGLCLCLRMGFLGYRKNYFLGEEGGMKPNGIGFRFAPEELMVGLELEF